MLNKLGLSSAEMYCTCVRSPRVLYVCSSSSECHYTRPLRVQTHVQILRTHCLRVLHNMLLSTPCESNYANGYFSVLHFLWLMPFSTVCMYIISHFRYFLWIRLRSESRSKFDSYRNPTLPASLATATDCPSVISHPTWLPRNWV